MADSNEFVGDDRLRAVGVHFSKNGQLLVVCYLAHGIMYVLSYALCCVYMLIKAPAVSVAGIQKREFLCGIS